MYSEDLEKLIDYALADGVITDKEKSIIFKKAKTLGIDKDEFEMVLEGKLSQKNLIEEQRNVATEKRRFYNKCPNCGESVRSFELNCSACGNEIIGIYENNYVRQLADKIDKMATENDKGGDRKYDYDQISQVIKNFPIPNTREDLISFLYFIGPKAKYNSSCDLLLIKAWRIKFEEVGHKLRFMLKDSRDTKEFSNYVHGIMKVNIFQRFWYGTHSITKFLLFCFFFPPILLWSLYILGLLKFDGWLFR